MLLYFWIIHGSAYDSFDVMDDFVLYLAVVIFRVLADLNASVRSEEDHRWSGFTTFLVAHDFITLFWCPNTYARICRAKVDTHYGLVLLRISLNHIKF